ncbi:hypothetical protein EJ06DRAFT_523155 [Trichodelitschia bisporula]|uniref:Uncharacterized protein n=1 Tax=Trichodelitschia bisporula TaxID=703511 RepID=A0A6G1HR08_9PEZI|nr:hypothetical protein EJ06DRAFT_523155 [Trichodelitschia bisporula]
MHILLLALLLRGAHALPSAAPAASPVPAPLPSATAAPAPPAPPTDSIPSPAAHHFPHGGFSPDTGWPHPGYAAPWAVHPSCYPGPATYTLPFQTLIAAHPSPDHGCPHDRGRALDYHAVDGGRGCCPSGATLTRPVVYGNVFIPTAPTLIPPGAVPPHNPGYQFYPQPPVAHPAPYGGAPPPGAAAAAYPAGYVAPVVPGQQLVGATTVVVNGQVSTVVYGDAAG